MAKNKILRNHGAFSLIELLMAITVLMILTGVFTLNPAIMGRQTAKHEAERIAEKLRSIALQAEREHISYIIQFPEKGDVEFDYFEIFTQTSDTLNRNLIETFKTRTGCKLRNKTNSVSDFNSASNNSESYIYDLQQNSFGKNGHIDVIGADNKIWYVILYEPGGEGGRIRISDKSPST